MNEIERLQQLAGIQKPVKEAETGDEVSKTVAGHTDDERDMIKKELFQMGTYAVELYKMLDKLPDNVDFPHWWQGKIVKASEYLSNSKHYLENELNVPEDDNVAVSPEVEDDNDPSGVS